MKADMSSGCNWCDEVQFKTGNRLFLTYTIQGKNLFVENSREIKEKSALNFFVILKTEHGVFLERIQTKGKTCPGHWKCLSVIYLETLQNCECCPFSLDLTSSYGIIFCSACLSQVSKVALWGCFLNYLVPLIVFVIVFVIAFVFVYVIVFLFVRPCPLITLIKCIKGHKSLGSLSEGVL